MGPQLGYYYPEIVIQADLHAPGLDAQGVVAPISPYVFIGRGRDFAWSLTSAGSENTQQFLEQLCNPQDESPPTRESTSYVYNGECVPMHTFDAGEIGAQGRRTGPRGVLQRNGPRSDHAAPCWSAAQPYAIANDRADARPRARGRGRLQQARLQPGPQPAAVLRSGQRTGDDVQHGLRSTTNTSPSSRPAACRSRPPGTNPSLPTLGTGEYDWKGFLRLAAAPARSRPGQRHFINWNNKPAPEWGAASDEFGYGPIHRVQLFKGFKAGMTEADDASIMNKAATQDLRAVEDLADDRRSPEHARPRTERTRQGSGQGRHASGSSRARAATARKARRKSGRGDPRRGLDADRRSGAEPGARRTATANFKSMRRARTTARTRSGSSYGGGWYGYVYKGLRQVLGDTVAQPLSRGYCGGGNLEACRNSLWAAHPGGVRKTRRPNRARRSRLEGGQVADQIPARDPEDGKKPPSNRSR